MRESRSSGSAGEPSGNGRLYPDCRPVLPRPAHKVIPRKTPSPSRQSHPGGVRSHHVIRHGRSSLTRVNPGAPRRESRQRLRLAPGRTPASLSHFHAPCYPGRSQTEQRLCVRSLRSHLAAETCPRRGAPAGGRRGRIIVGFRLAPPRRCSPPFRGPPLQSCPSATAPRLPGISSAHGPLWLRHSPPAHSWQCACFRRLPPAPAPMPQSVPLSRVTCAPEAHSITCRTAPAPGPAVVALSLRRVHAPGCGCRAWPRRTERQLSGGR